MLSCNQNREIRCNERPVLGGLRATPLQRTGRRLAAHVARSLTKVHEILAVEALFEEVDEHSRTEARCLGVASRANTSMTIMPSPRQGQGRGGTRG